MLPPELTDALDAAARSPRLLVTSDFDGTLSPIVSNPADARPLPAAGDALIALAGLPDTEVALISGRALRDLRVLSSMPRQSSNWATTAGTPAERSSATIRAESCG